MNFKALAALVTGLLILMTTGHTVMAKTMETKTYCVGRLLIDVPTEFEVMDFGGSVRGIRIERVASGDEKEAERLFSERVRKLKAGEFYKDTVKMLFRSVDQVGSLRTLSYLVDWSDAGFQPQEPWTVETFVSVDAVVFHLETAMDNESKNSSEADLVSVASAIRPREFDEIPKETGVCLKDAFVALPHGTENAHALFRDPEQFVGMEVDFLTRKAGERDIDLTAPESDIGNSVSIAGLKGREAKDYGKEFFFHAAVGKQVAASHNGYAVDLSYFDRRKNFGSEPYSQSFAEKAWENLIEGTAE